MHSSDKFYTLFAEDYSKYAKNKVQYLLAVDNFIISESFKNDHDYIVDIGSGDGKRSKGIFKKLKARELATVDNSDGMIEILKNNKNDYCHIIKADIGCSDFMLEKKYDIALCLWNVLGHIPKNNIKQSINNLSELIKDNGLLFLDVNNRYNISHYGFYSVAINMIKDLILFNRKSNGDYKLEIDVSGKKIMTMVHIFNPYEIEKIIKESGLIIKSRLIINYKTGEIKRFFWQGQLVYKITKK